MPFAIGVNSTRPLPRALPSDDMPAPAKRSRRGASISDSPIFASKRALIMPTPTVTSARYWLVPSASSAWQPGITLASASGSSSTAKMASGDAGKSTLPCAVSAFPPPGIAGFAGGVSRNSGRDGAGSSIPMSAMTFEGVSGKRISSTPSASATAFAMHGGVLMLLPSPSPFAPNGVNGVGVSRCTITGSGTSQVVGIR